VEESRPVAGHLRLLRRANGGGEHGARGGTGARLAGAAFAGGSGLGPGTHLRCTTTAPVR
jgi:hypothetical protein